MPLFNFLKTKKDQGAVSKFIGRHQQVCTIKKFLGEEVPDLELQIATNKDNSERDEIIAKVVEAEKYIASDMFTNRFDVESVNKDMRELIGDGYQNCVLENDTVLENRCFKIFDDTHKYLENSLKKEEASKATKFADLSEQIRSLFYVEGIVNYIRLGGLLTDSSFEQKTWIIINSLFYSNKLVRDASSLLPPEPSAQEADKLRTVANKLLSDQKINSNDMQKIEIEIKEGLALCAENYKDKI
jgi:hypothetical protein